MTTYTITVSIHDDYVAGVIGLDRISRKRRSGKSAPVPRLPVGEVGDKVGAHVPKTQGLKRRGRGPRSCNRESAREACQTNS